MAALKQIFSSFMQIGAIWIALALGAVIGLIYLILSRRKTSN
jgi:hypothetical protein